MFHGKVAVVTGGAGGIGREIAASFSAAGARVAVIDKNKEAGEAFAQKDANIRFFHGNIAQKAALEEFARETVRQFSQVDFLVNNACLSRRGLLSDCSWEDFEYVQRVGVTAPYYLTLLLKDAFAQGGSIVNISSTRYIQSQPDTESYTAAKGGISALTHAMCVSFAGRVRVNAISPGWIETQPDTQHSASDKAQHPAGAVGRTQNIADLALFLCSEKAAFISGQNIAVDGGMTKLMIYHGDCGWTYQAP